jgi:hypothetical protein
MQVFEYLDTNILATLTSKPSWIKFWVDMMTHGSFQRMNIAQNGKNIYHFS